MTTHPTWHLAQVNIAELKVPIGHPDVQDFVDGLAPINAQAEASSGFLWRLQDEAGDATQIAYDPNPLLIVNLSVWESADALKAFTYSPEHLAYLRRRREWFSRLATPHFCMWWIPAGHHPTPAEARERLSMLETHGPSAAAFTFSRLYSPEPASPASSHT
ncbi:DUF3291 domain-containing protein [Deinococcus sp. KNUC1210]|uniref:DUF3291 domain-containing protein n=1 Tax=Deinococcus sp. KNUC1210 TaxID=2917691 RepID=UPI001EF0A2FE|nr:DUF3291 domain-containing protein [Deinococcus sp. KNUC1210]ULH16787.1 DUF3291 domain-containing protein [Deinococcus sp. KNUC1210]